jgi:predicted 3-demethylubiquinone-9 3-methyltransferase (glyoxalase superfamily)
MQKITPCLWFDNQAEEAVAFYMSIFKDAEITEVSHFVEDSHGEPGKVMTVDFKLAGQDFMAVNGGPDFKFSEAISLFVLCETQEEVDMYWEKLTEGGEESQCGWLKDKYGVSWQIVPSILGKWVTDPDKAKARRVTEAMLKMSKLDIETLRKAYEGG